MRHIANIRLRLAAFLLLMGGALTWTSCSDDDVCYDGVDNEEKEVTVRLNISAGNSGGISVSRADDDEDANALDGEYMNTLCVFVVDEDDKIVARLEPTSTTGWAGETSEWTSDALTLATGSYTVYAFSNWETVENESWNTIIAKTIDATLTESELNIDISDPASKVDIASGKYIPMSGKQEITVSSESTSFDVGMDRLVGRVEITIDGETGTDAEDVTVTSLSFGNCADKVSLMSENTASSVEYNTGYSDNTMETTITANTTGNSLAVFYVNETFRPSTGYGYEITLNTDRYGGTYYTATTERHDIERNCIYPITLTLDNNVLDLEVTAWTDPLGIEEVPYLNIEMGKNTYTVTLIDKTSTFQLSPSMLHGTTPIETASWDWTYHNEDDDSQITYEDDGSVIVTSLTATPGYSYSFTLVANWTTTSSSGVITTHSRTYNIIVTLVEGWPEFEAPARKSSWKTMVGGSELINLLLNSKRAEL